MNGAPRSLAAQGAAWRRAIDVAILVLRTGLGALLLFESLHLVFDAHAAPHYAQRGFPTWSLPALAWSEASASILFLFPPTSLLGAGLLLAVLGWALGMHVAIGQLRTGLLVDIGLVLLVGLGQLRLVPQRSRSGMPARPDDAF